MMNLVTLRPRILSFFPDHLRVFVPRAKNDIYREGNYVYIKRLGNKYCPVALLEGYISMCGIELSSSVALSSPVRFFKSTNTYKLHGVKLSYTRCREIFKECLKGMGVNHKLYGLHSLRSGGATVEPLYNEVLGITNDCLQPGQNYSKMYGTGPRYNEPRYNEILVITNTIQKPERKIYLDITNNRGYDSATQFHFVI